jgi:ribonucleoside-diphosphate reductase alpha chain
MEDLLNRSSQYPGQTLLASPFINPLAVEVWDTWFRWREFGQLRDLTIDATWDRVATALMGVESGIDRGPFKRRLMDAFASWQLLLDERVLETAGTPTLSWRNDDLVAVLNVARFVRAPCTQHASFDHVTFEDVAALAVRALDNAALVHPTAARPANRLRIGVIGLGDAFALLGLPYDSAAARAQAAVIARALANGCLTESIGLARERGPSVQCGGEWHRRAGLRGISNVLIEDAAHQGLRYTRLTAITSQQRLAWFANHVSDALDPALARASTQTIPSADGRRAMDSDGYTATLSRLIGGLPSNSLVPAVAPVSAQLRLRAAMQNWIDERIAYPVQVDNEPSVDRVTTWAALAADLGLGEFVWRLASNGSRIGAKT